MSEFLDVVCKALTRERKLREICAEFGMEVDDLKKIIMLLENVGLVLSKDGAVIPTDRMKLFLDLPVE